jgi:hypoxanthine phosphoribosyltransferase
MTRLRCELVSQEAVYELCWELARAIRSSGFRPDVLVAISRGGCVPARYLCDFLDISALTTVKVEHYVAGAHKQQRTVIRYPLSGTIEDQRVLVVDDVNDTGDTLVAALDHLDRFGAREIRTAVLHEKSTTERRADYAVVEVKDWHWIVYPWAVFEDLGSFLEEMEPVPAQPDEAARRLWEEHCIRIGRHQLERILASLPGGHGKPQT